MQEPVLTWGRAFPKEGKRDECLICKVPCRTVLLSKRVSEFQEKHRRRLIAFYGEKVTPVDWQRGEQRSRHPALISCTPDALDLVHVHS
ncbi:hypothetical protein E2I00_008830 [Balaenoptera physalus]|uniref:Uncharacterized protein n=1 Tax=Balaenoptera physalus TaxID=9770 RepID=A0A643CDI1_BALPH|nr:hypothetical protein E2I00_008830 [Balaenoptera physalus]